MSTIKGRSHFDKPGTDFAYNVLVEKLRAALEKAARYLNYAYEKRPYGRKNHSYANARAKANTSTGTDNVTFTVINSLDMLVNVL